MAEQTALDIEFRRSALRALKKLDRGVQRRIVAAIKKLATEPHPSSVESIKGSPGYVRIRVGDYRVIYTVGGDTVTVAKVAHRSEVYERLRELHR